MSSTARRAYETEQLYGEPSTSGKLTASLDITYIVSGSPQTQFVALTGTAAEPGPPETVTLSAGGLTFEPQKEGTTSPAGKTITLTNSGTTALTGMDVVVSGTNAKSFIQKNSCGTTVETGKNCVLTVGFSPLSTARITATLNVTYSVNGTKKT